MLALADPNWVVADLGCGTGALTATLAPFVRQVIAVDASAAMLAAARRRLDGTTNVDIRQGELESLPIDDGQSGRRRAVARAALRCRAGEGVRRGRARTPAAVDGSSSST